VIGSVQIVHGERGHWLQLWADFYNPDSYVLHQLVRHSLAVIAQRSSYQPIYVGVCDYQGSLGALLSDYGFAPITDRTKMVKPVMQWVREVTLEPSLILKPTAPVIGAPFVQPTPPATSPPYRSVGGASPVSVLLGDDGGGVAVHAVGAYQPFSCCPEQRSGAESW
jgi:hypothetical protein